MKVSTGKSTVETLSCVHISKDLQNDWTTPSGLLCETVRTEVMAQRIQKPPQQWMQHIPAPQECPTI